MSQGKANQGESTPRRDFDEWLTEVKTISGADPCSSSSDTRDAAHWLAVRQVFCSPASSSSTARSDKSASTSVTPVARSLPRPPPFSPAQSSSPNGSKTATDAEAKRRKVDEARKNNHAKETVDLHRNVREQRLLTATEKKNGAEKMETPRSKMEANPPTVRSAVQRAERQKLQAKITAQSAVTAASSSASNAPILSSLLPKSEMDYGIDDLSSGDDTDREETPRKTVPQWAQGDQLLAAVADQLRSPPETRLLSALMSPPDLAQIFSAVPERLLRRTSSAEWNSAVIDGSLLTDVTSGSLLVP